MKQSLSVSLSNRARPWDEETCHSALYPDIHLTFSWGEPVRPTRLYRILEMGRREIEALKRAGYGQFPLPERKFTIDYIPSIQMALVAQKRRQIFGFKEFKLNDVLASIDLLELCGLAREEYFEMWAYVFVDDFQVGFIFIGRVDLRAVSSPPNGTSSISTS
ncbi:MAG: hypothetical protein LQ349_001070 [Xanthoria aureola]|nr:MAG: hypothetical protein LQ349_001070 [Xanthoria aureola]